MVESVPTKELGSWRLNYIIRLRRVRTTRYEMLDNWIVTQNVPRKLASRYGEVKHGISVLYACIIVVVVVFACLRVCVCGMCCAR